MLWGERSSSVMIACHAVGLQCWVFPFFCSWRIKLAWQLPRLARSQTWNQRAEKTVADPCRENVKPSGQHHFKPHGNNKTKQTRRDKDRQQANKTTFQQANKTTRQQANKPIERSNYPVCQIPPSCMSDVMNFVFLWQSNQLVPRMIDASWHFWSGTVNL